MKPTAFIVVLVFLVGCDQPQQQAAAPTPLISPIQAVAPVNVQAEPVYGKNNAETFTAKVVRIVDGDTVEGLTTDNTKFKIRLEGIDTPEPKQAFGNVAKKAVGDLTHEKDATILKTGQDFYGRTLAFVVVDGVNVNAEMIRLGMAWHYVKYNQSEELAAMELEAREAKRGLWGDTQTPVEPWEWQYR